MVYTNIDIVVTPRWWGHDDNSLVKMKCGVNTSDKWLHKWTYIYKCEQECEQMLKVKPQHRKQGKREHVLCVKCAACIVCTVYSTCKWDRIVRTVVQYVLCVSLVRR